MNESTETPTETTPEPTEHPGPSAIRVYVCPQCGCWYGSSEVTNLAETHNHRSSMSNLASEDPSQWGASTGKRSMCQRCKSHGHNVERVLVTFIREDAIAKQFGIAMEQSA